MARRLDLAKAVAWRERLGRFSSTELTVAGFCREEGVSVASFYQWRKRLGPQPSGRRKNGQATGFQAVVVKPAMVAGSAAVVELESGARIEVPSDNLELVRTVVAELARTSP